MWYERMDLEDWFDTYQFAVDYDVGESAVKFLTLGDLGMDLTSVALRYGHHKGLPELREVLANDYEGLSADDVIVTAGGSEANFAIVSALVKPGDHVVVEHPNYPSLYEVPRSLGCDVTLFRLRRENAFKPDWDELERLITPKTKLISLTHPNNPTGSMIDTAEFERAVSIAESYGVYLLFDETYRELSYGEQLPGAGASSPHVISLSSMSKSYGLPGIRIGWLATRSAEVRDAVLAIREQVTITNSALGEQIAFSVLKRKTEFIDRARTHVQQNFEIVRTWMATQEALDWIEPGAGVVGFPWIVDSRIDPEEIYTRLVKEYRSFVIPGRCFEMDNAHFRLGYGGANDELQVGLVNIGNAIADSLD